MGIGGEIGGGFLFECESDLRVLGLWIDIGVEGIGWVFWLSLVCMCMIYGGVGFSKNGVGVSAFCGVETVGNGVLF